MGANFKRQADEECTSLAMDRDNVTLHGNGFISAAIPMYNKLHGKTNEQLIALYPAKSVAVIAVRDWLDTKAVAVKNTLTELKVLLEA